MAIPLRRSLRSPPVSLNSTIRIVKRVSPKKLGKKQRRRHSIMAFEMIRLDRTAEEPLHEQLYRQIRDELTSASFNNNSSRLPSSRDAGRRPGSIAIHCKRRLLEASRGRVSSIQDWIGHVRRRAVARNFPECATGKSRTTHRTPTTPFRSCKKHSGSYEPENSSISESPAHPASPLFPLSRRLMNFRSQYGNDSEQKSSQKKERICSSMLQAVVTPTCARRSQLICAITEVHAVIQTRSSSQPERSRQ